MIILGSNYRASGPPVYLPTTEAAADTNTFVCEFAGGSAANETGVGGGFTGADLVLTQAGSVAAASGGYRQLDGSDDRFTCTGTLANGIFGGSEWTAMWEVTDWTHVSGKYLCYFAQTSPTQLFNISKQGAGGNVGSLFRALAGYTHNTQISTPAETANNARTVHAAWYKNGVMHYGWIQSASAYPTGWDDFPVNQRGAIRHAGFAGVTFAANLEIVGSTNGYPTLKIGRVIMSKTGLAAAPV